MTTFPKLYGLPSNGKKIKEWSISVHEENGSAFIKRIHGYQNCKMQETTKEISKGKNIGKKNETTPFQQATNEAQSLWKKQVESGYKDNAESLNQTEKVLPMLAHDFNKRGKDIQFPCFIQPKLDGVRLLIKITPSEIKCFSRTGKEFTTLGHITDQLRQLKVKNGFLDGELFTFDIPFEEISGLCRKQEITENHNKLKFYIFDTFTESDERPFTERYAELLQHNKLIEKKKLDALVLVQTDECNTRETLQEYHQKYIEESYEGVIVRNKTGQYKPGFRSKELQKYKEFLDEEFEIINAQSGVGLEQDCAIFTCKNKDNQEFAVRPRGTRELRKEYLKNKDELIGKMLTVRYQNLSETGIVRFGVGIAIRDYE